MNYQELVELLNKKINYYSIEFPKTEQGFFIEFFEKYPYNQSINWIDIKASDLLKAIIYELGIQDEVNIQSAMAADFIKLDTIKSMVEIITNIEENEVDRYNLMLKKLDSKVNKKTLDKLDAFNDIPKEIINFFNSNINGVSELNNIFIKLKEKSRMGLFLQILSFKTEFEKAVSSFENLDNNNTMIMSNENSIKVIKSKSDVLNMLIKHPKVSKIKEQFQVIYDYGMSKTQGLNNKKCKKIVYTYYNLLKILDKEKDNVEIKNIDLILDNALEDDVRTACLKFIYSHNQIYYERLEEDYLQQSANSLNSFISYFSTIGLDFNNLNNSIKSKIMEESIDLVKSKMQYIRELSNEENYIEILINTTLERLKMINIYISKDYITKEFIKNNKTILTTDDDFENLKENINDLLSYNINLLKYSNKDFLLSDNKVLRDNLILLEKLGISFNMCNNLTMLCCPLKEKIEAFIEVGLEDIIKINVDILNADINLAKRIIVSKLVGFNYLENGKLSDLIINKDNFFIPDNIIDKYVFDRDNSQYLCSSKVFIPGNVKTEFSYIVDDIIIPKTRIRNQPVPLVDIIKPSLYTKEEIKKLEKLM